ncbi:hypothetical protein JVU11DRAFT_11056 [Chiua virens]|nr:hypothetical protein JVU11DRAFT_11056 [Chiua virens]
MFLAASKAFFLETKRTSERIQREERLMRAVPSNELSPIDGQAPKNTPIEGIAVALSGSYDEHAKRKMLAAMNAMALRAKASDPFVDDLQIPQLGDGDSIMTLADTASQLSQDIPSNDSQRTDLTSPSSTYHFHFHNSLLAAGSNVHGLTMNQGDGNLGSSMTVTEQPDQ